MWPDKNPNERHVTNKDYPRGQAYGFETQGREKNKTGKDKTINSLFNKLKTIKF